MATISSDTASSAQKRPQWMAVLSITEMWTSLAIVVMWLAVLVAAVYGPDIVSQGVAGDSSRVPSSVAVALFAAVATWAVAKYGFRRDNRRVP